MPGDTSASTQSFSNQELALIDLERHLQVTNEEKQ
jgi:hypothetical protein